MNRKISCLTFDSFLGLGKRASVKVQLSIIKGDPTASSEDQSSRLSDSESSSQPVSVMNQPSAMTDGPTVSIEDHINQISEGKSIIQRVVMKDQLNLLKEGYIISTDGQTSLLPDADLSTQTDSPENQLIEIKEGFTVIKEDYSNRLANRISPAQLVGLVVTESSFAESDRLPPLPSCPNNTVKKVEQLLPSEDLDRTLSVVKPMHEATYNASQVEKKVFLRKSIESNEYNMTVEPYDDSVSNVGFESKSLSTALVKKKRKRRNKYNVVRFSWH